MIDIVTIKQIRKQLGLTQKEMADELGISQMAYCYREWGRLKLQIEDAKKLAELGGVSINDIDQNIRNPLYQHKRAKHTVGRQQGKNPAVKRNRVAESGKSR